MSRTLRVAAICFVDPYRRLLTVRKRDTTAFMLPGGKLDCEETAIAAAVRELNEELGLVLPESALEPFGEWTVPAANEPGAHVHATVFQASLPGAPAPAAEIAEVRWVPVTTPELADLAPLLRSRVLPALAATL